MNKIHKIIYFKLDNENLNEYNLSNDTLDKYLEDSIELEEYCKKRNAVLDYKQWNEILNIVEIMKEFNDDELNIFCTNIIKDIKNEFKDLAVNDKFNEVGGRKYINTTPALRIAAKN